MFAFLLVSVIILAGLGSASAVSDDVIAAIDDANTQINEANTIVEDKVTEINTTLENYYAGSRGTPSTNLASAVATSQADANKVIKLTSDYKISTLVTLNSNWEGYTIDGQGHIIDGDNTVGIFVVQANNLVLKNIIFINGKAANGGALFVKSTDVNIINCTFAYNNLPVLLTKIQLVKLSHLLANVVALLLIKVQLVIE